MKRLLLVTVLLFQLHSVFGQCTITQGTELNNDVTYYKCQNGYEAPVGFEWMKPTKIYIGPYGRGTNAKPLDEASYMLFLEAFYRGDNLQEANNNYMINKKKRGNENRNTFIPAYEFICLDCGLGYFATVSLTDGYENHGEIESYPNVSMGYTCAQPTLEEAIKVAFKAAKDQLKTPAVWFTINAGVNCDTEPENTKENILYYTYAHTYGAQSRGFLESATSYMRLPESADDFLEYVKSLNVLCDQLGVENTISRLDDLGYSKSWKQIGSGINGMTNKEYPVFSKKINPDNYSGAAGKFQKAIGSATGEASRPIAQNTNIKVTESQQKTTTTEALVQSGIKSLYGIADAIRENKLRKEQKEEEAKIWLQKRAQEKLAKEEEEKLKFAQLLTEAESGSFDAQYKIAKKYGEDDETYRSSLYFYKMAYNNANKKLSEDFLIGYTDKLQDAGNIVELESIILNTDYTSKYPLIKIKSAFYRIFVNDYYANYEDFFIQEGINQLKELINQKINETPALLYAYMQVTGEYEKFGIPVNEKEGLKILNEKANRWANYYLGLVYLKGTSSIKKNEKKAKELFRECAGIDKKYTKSDAYNYILLRLRGNKELSIYSPQVLSYIEFAKLTENEKHDSGSSMPSEIFYKFPGYNASFIPRNDMGFVTKYVPNLFNMRNLQLSGLNTDKNERFGLPNFPDNNTIIAILVNYPLSWCKICFEQYQNLKKVNKIYFLTIQVATAFDITKEQSHDLFYYEGGSQRTDIGTTSTVTVRNKISNDAVLYTNLKDFDVAKLDEKGSLPAIYFYKNNELRKVQTGLTDEKTINEIISQIE